MIEESYIFDISKEKWVITENLIIKNHDNYNLPISLIMGFDDSDEKWIWCANHHRYEIFRDGEGLYFHSESNCEIFGIPIYYRFNAKAYDPLGNKNIVLRWRIYQREATQPIVISADIILLSFCKMYYLKNSAPRLNRFTYFNYSINMETEHIRHFYARYHNKTETIPSVVIDRVIDILADLNTGIRPTVITGLKGSDKLQAFIARPFDINSYALKDFMGNFDNIVPRYCKDGYRQICEALSISPPKSLRKIYIQNPYALIMYSALLELGIKDYNFMRPFFSRTNIANMNFKFITACKIRYLDENKEIEPSNDEQYGCITQEDIELLLHPELIPNYDDWDQLVFFTKWIIEEKGEKWAAKQLLFLSQHNDNYVNRDIYNMIYDYFGELSKNAKKLFLKKGFTIKLHDILVEEVNQYKYGHDLIDYQPYEYDYEMQINDYKFMLPKYADDVAKIGKSLHNCVASYMDKIMRKNSTIVYVTKDNNYIACIEVEKGKITQVLGDYNRQIDNQLCLTVMYWGETLRIKWCYVDEMIDKEEDLYHTPKEYWRLQNLSDKPNYFILDLENLIQIPLEERQEGFYRALGVKAYQTLRAEDFRRRHFDNSDTTKTWFKIPPIELIKDEKAYFKTASPILEIILRGANEGNGEAQWVMADIYEDFGEVVPRNVNRRDCWIKKANESGEPYFSCLEHIF